MERRRSAAAPTRRIFVLSCAFHGRRDVVERRADCHVECRPSTATPEQASEHVSEGATTMPPEVEEASHPIGLLRRGGGRPEIAADLGASIPTTLRCSRTA
ncbi:Hypothetical predicted protein [Cloeon dipterum]|uniref:Uncharacterized protein n=1 Tax=Cloeon dipterum TaxID=197152 RepID=A0A8S1BZC7_9INSE|nr:Hypothetical predicted protein [Cloeon dipterum]